MEHALSYDEVHETLARLIAESARWREDQSRRSVVLDIEVVEYLYRRLEEHRESIVDCEEEEDLLGPASKSMYIAPTEEDPAIDFISCDTCGTVLHFPHQRFERDGLFFCLKHRHDEEE